MGSCCNKLCCSVVSILLGFLLVLGASLFIGLKAADQLINQELNSKLFLNLNSFLFPQWQNPAPPIYMQYWMFNVTNSENVSKGHKPSVEQIGPFTYRLYQPKTDIAFYANNTVSYKFNHTLVFQPDKSVGSLDMPITQLNVPMLTLQSLAKKFKISSVLMNIIVNSLNDSTLFVSHSVEEWLFGYPDPVFEAVHNILKWIGIKINFAAKFGLFVGYNNSNDGVYLVNTGKDDITLSNQICKWNGKETLSWWTSKEANMVNGTDGTFMPPKTSTSDKLYLFVTDVCRSLYVKFSHHTSVRDIKTLRFHMPAKVFANATINHDNQGFCVPAGNCLDSGVLDISSCKQGAPIVISSPHFYLGAEEYINGVNGMHPNKNEHETYLDIEPMTGLVFSAAKRLQINAHLQNLNVFSSMKQVEEVIMPMLWLNESVMLDQATANMFKSDVLVLINAVNALQYVVLAIGLILLILGIGLLICWKKKHKSLSENLLINEQSDEE